MKEVNQDQLKLIEEKPQKIEPLAAEGAFIVRVRTEGERTRLLIAAEVDGHWHVWQTLEREDGSWTGVLCLPQFIHHATPRTEQELIAFARWFCAPLRGVA